MQLQSIDTPAEVEKVQIDRYREMGPRERLMRVADLNAALDRLALAGLRARRTEPLSPELERLHLFALRLSRAEMRSAFGWDPTAASEPGG